MLPDAVAPAVVKQLPAPQIRRDIETSRNKALSDRDMAQVERAYPQYLTRNEFTRHLVEENGRYKLNLCHGQMQINGKP